MKKALKKALKSRRHTGRFIMMKKLIDAAGIQKKPVAKATYDSLDLRLAQAQAKCCQQYDSAVKDLKAHHGAMSRKEEAVLSRIEMLRPKVEAVLAGREGLTKETAHTCLRYLQSNARLRKIREARRLSYGATLPPQGPGGQKIGDALG